MIKYLVEFLGTFFFLNVIMIASNANIQWAFLPIGLALSMVVYWGGTISGGHFNPAVSLMFFANNKLSWLDTILYIISQIIGGLFALFFYKMNFTK